MSRFATTPPPPRVAHHRAGLTLMELLLALGGTGLIAAAVVTMIYAASRGTNSSTDIRTLVVKHRVIATRLNAAVRSSKMVLAQGTGYLVLWIADTEPNDTPNLSEIRRLEWDPATDELWSYKAPANLSQANNTQYNLTDDFNAVTSALKGTANFPGERWATTVTDWTLTLDNPNPQSAALVSYRVSVQAGTQTDTSIGAAALRNE